jgi:hypothetical protein
MRHILVYVAFILVAGTLLAQSSPSISGLSTPYLPLQSSVTIGAVNYAPGTVAYGPLGTPVIISGTNLGNAGTVSFPGQTLGSTVSAPVVSWTPTQIVVSVPSGSTTGNVVVTVSGHNSNGLPFIVVGKTSGATYSASCPTSIPATQLTINTTTLPTGAFGVNYNASLQASGGQTPYSWSSLSGLPAGLSVTSSGTIIGTPSSFGSNSVIVRVSDNQQHQVSATVPLVVNANPQITGLSLVSGPPQMGFVISGSGFGSSQGTSTVSIGSLQFSVVNWASTAITAQVPPTATTSNSGNLAVTVNGVSSSSVPFTVTSLFGCSSQ